MNLIPNFLRNKKLEKRASVNEAGANNLFGTMGTRSFPVAVTKDFIPNGVNGETLDLTGGDVGAKWIGLETRAMQFWAYNYCAPLAAVIDRLAEAHSNGRVEFIDEDTSVTVKKWNKNPKLVRVRKLLKNPNPFQTWEEFDSQQQVYSKLFGYCPVFAVCPVGMDKSYTRAMFNLNPFFCMPQANYDYDMFDTSKGGLIKLWRITIQGKSYDIDSSDILLLKDGYIESSITSFGLPLSKVAGLDFFVSNICAANEADNVLLKKKGPLGVFSWDPKGDMAGSAVLDPESQDQLQTDLNRYGLTVGQLQHIISKMPIKWNAMSFNLRDLMTKETIRSGIDAICDRFGYPAELMSGKNATYENRDSAEKYLYQNNVIPFSLRCMARYNEFFGLDGTVLNLDYDHLPVLQEDLLKAGEAYKAESEGLQIEWTSGMINWNQWQLAKNRDTVEGMDIYYPEWAKKNGINLNPQKQKDNGKKPAPKDTGATQ